MITRVDDVNDAVRGVDVRVLDVGHLLRSADVHACQEMMRYLELRPAGTRSETVVLDFLRNESLQP